MVRRKKTTGPFSVVTIAWAIAFLPLVGVQASTFQKGDNIHISNVHQIDDDLYAFGQNVTVDGHIEGDLIAGAYEVFVNGEVAESEDVFAYKLHHAGTVGNSLRAFVNTVIIDGHVGRSAMIFAYDSHIGKGAVVERDLFIGSYTARVDGTIGRNATIRADRITISGEIAGNVDIEANEISIVPPAVIRGDLTYTCKKAAEIDTAAGVTILGETHWKQPEEAKGEAAQEKNAGAAAFKSVTLKISKILAAFLFGIIVVYLFRKRAEESFRQLRTRFSLSVATGFLFLIILIATALILIVSVVFLVVGLALISGKLAPLGALVLVLSMLMVPLTAFTTVSGGIILYSGKILFAFLIGYLLIRVFKLQPATLGRGQLLLGLVALGLLIAVPYVGILIYVLVSMAGAGAIVLAIRNCRREADQAKGDSSTVAGRG